MFDLGDELIFLSNRIPWLIWIQLLVTLLLIVLLCYGFTSTFTMDLSTTANSSASASASASFAGCRLLSSNQPQMMNNTIAGSSHNSQVRKNKSRKGDARTRASTSREIERAGDDNQERVGSSRKDASHCSTHFRHSFHPCHYIGLAKEALLKCLGLDSSSENSLNQKNRKEQ